MNQDHFPRRESSLQKLFIKSGSIHPPEIIPPRYFLQIRITFPPKMHPQPRFQANQDNSLTKSPVPNASPTASISSRSNFSHQRMRHIIVTFKLYPQLKKQISRSVSDREIRFRHEPMIAFRDRYLNNRTCSFQSSSEQNTSASIRFYTVPKAPVRAPAQSGSDSAQNTSFSLRSVPLRPQREWFLSHSLQDRLPGTGMHLPPPAARPCGRAESEHIRVSPFPPAGWQPCPFW